MSEGSQNRKRNVVNVAPVVFYRGFLRRLSHFKYIVIAGDIFAISINLYRDFIAIIS